MEAIKHPEHYNLHPSGVECIDIIEHMSWTLGSAVKYVWRADHKDNAIEDLKKAVFCIEREIQRRSAEIERKSKEEIAREAQLSERIESEWTTGTARFDGQAYHQERSLFDPKHYVQHDKAWADYIRTQREDSLCGEAEESEPGKGSLGNGDLGSYYGFPNGYTCL